jgi:pyruvate dehydrogenase E2 component (dihydrolipoamide acetyltransferase)
MTSEFALPDAGEGLTEAEIVAWRVAVGDTVTVNQVLVEIETAKSLVELPSPFSGIVTALLVSEGQTVEVGTPIISVETVADHPVDTIAADAVADTAGSISAEPDGSGAVLVGYGTRGPVSSRRRSRTAVAGKRPSVPAVSGVLAKPPVRKLAKDLGVDLATVPATGAVGEVTREDVLGHAAQASVFRNLETPKPPAAREERIPVRGVRKAIASAMVSSAFTAPHVSLFVDVDATRTMEFVGRLKKSTDFAGIKLSPLLVLAKALIWAVRRNPSVNAQWTDTEIIVKHYVNLGIAAATPRGLIVPNVKDAQELSLVALASAIEHLTITAREGTTTPAETAGGTITITNIGVFGMDTGTPILNPGEVGIVALGTIKPRPWVVDGEVRPRLVTTLGASFDHRVVDGDVASRFLADVASIIEEPALLLE